MSNSEFSLPSLFASASQVDNLASERYYNRSYDVVVVSTELGFGGLTVVVAVLSRVIIAFCFVWPSFSCSSSF